VSYSLHLLFQMCNYSCMAKPPKQTPTGQFDKASARELQRLKAVDHLEGEMDRKQGRLTRMSKDGGTNRRVRK
jgi:hypothetical protein